MAKTLDAPHAKGAGFEAIELTATTDLSGIDGTGELGLGNVLHKTFVRVDEKGSEAAGATAVVVDGGVAMPVEPPVSMVVDRPFLFLIRDRATGAILFVGHVVAPTVG